MSDNINDIQNLSNFLDDTKDPLQKTKRILKEQLFTWRFCLIKRLEYYKSLGFPITVENQDFNDVTILNDIPDDEPKQVKNLAKTVFRIYHKSPEEFQLLVISLYIKKPNDDQGTILVQGNKCPTFGVTEFNKLRYLVENVEIPSKDHLHNILEDLSAIPLTQLMEEKHVSNNSSVLEVDSNTQLKAIDGDYKRPQNPCSSRARSLSGSRTRRIKEIDETIITEITTEIATVTARETTERHCEHMFDTFMQEIDQRLSEFRIQQYNEQKAVLSQLERENEDLRSSLLKQKNENQKLSSQQIELKKQSQKFDQQLRDLARENMQLKITIDTQSQIIHEIKTMQNKQTDQQKALYVDIAKCNTKSQHADIALQQIPIQHSPSAVINTNSLQHRNGQQEIETFNKQSQNQFSQKAIEKSSVQPNRLLHQMSINPGHEASSIIPQNIPVHVTPMNITENTASSVDINDAENTNYGFNTNPLDALLSIKISDNTDYLLIGDSCFSMIQPQKMNTGSYQSVQKVSVSGSKVSDVIQWLNQLPVNKNVKKLVCHVGVNDMVYGFIPESIWSNLISLLQYKFPQSHITMSSIIPTKSMKETNIKIYQSNESLSNACTQKAVLFVDHTTTFRTAKNAPKQALYQTHQQKHPSIRGMLLLARNLKYPGVDFKKRYEDQMKSYQNAYLSNVQKDNPMFNMQKNASYTNKPNGSNEIMPGQYYNLSPNIPQCTVSSSIQMGQNVNGTTSLDETISNSTDKNELANKITLLIQELLK